MPGQDLPNLPGIVGSAALATTPTPGSVQTYTLAEKAEATRPVIQRDSQSLPYGNSPAVPVKSLGSSCVLLRAVRREDFTDGSIRALADVAGQVR